jgi:O-antigen ligase
LQLTRPYSRARQAAAAIAWIGTVYSFYGLAVYFSGNHWLLLFHKWAYEDSLTSTFVNRNSFATFAGLCLLCALRPIAEQVQTILRSPLPLRMRMAEFLECLLTSQRIAMVQSLIIGSALLATTSRAGVAATGVAVLVLAQTAGGRKSLRSWRGLALLCLFGAIMGGAYLASNNRLAERYASEGVSIDDDSRGEIYRAIIDAIGTSPWTGTGFGTFSDVFPAYRDGSRIHTHLWDKAHNTYLENTLELGVPAASALVLAVGLLAWRCGVGLITRRRANSLPATGLAASVLIGLHALIDFSMQMPAVAILYAFVLGFSVSQSWSTQATSRQSADQGATLR